MLKKIIFTLIFLYLAAGMAFALDEITAGEILNLQRCIDIARQNHPAISAAQYNIRASESRIGQARAGYMPQLTFQSGYQRLGPAQLTSVPSDPYNYYSNMLSLNQTLFDFGKTFNQIQIQSLNTESAKADFQDVSGYVVFSVKRAYYVYLQAKMSADVAAETVNKFQQHLEIATAFFETGKRSKIDVTSAEVNLSNAKINLLKAENTLRLARANLNNAMGLKNAPLYQIKEDLVYKPYDITLAQALRRAYEARPDLLSTAKKKEALEKTVVLNQKGYLPVLSGSAAYGYLGNDHKTDENWNIGVMLTFPLFTGFSTKYQVDEAKANLNAFKANENSLLQQVSLEVESAYLSFKEAGERIGAGEIIVRQAEENVELATGRYEAGVGSSIEITDAMIALNNAKMTYITALTDYHIALANLERAMGESK
ncbi:MAG TPA: TolC family protein [Smithellaceae bacterium]|nr:TolC family protein [Smithellaceae bacterium]HRS88670.1 TolC family protein [Smithellaceae bacterium]HRV27098.1 TolC family protein [Smithellaceae bacterium]